MNSLKLNNLPRWLRDFVPLIGWMAFIFALSSQSTLVEIENETSEKFVFKLAHILAYMVLAWFWWRALSPRRQVNGPVLLAAFVLTTLYGISDEIHQLYVPGRHGRVADVLFDASGALLMILLLRWFERLRGFPEALPAKPKLKDRQLV